MTPQNLSIEIGKLMSSVQNLQTTVSDLKKELNQFNTKFSDISHEITQFMTNVQNKTTCQILHQHLQDEFVLRQEFAPIKHLIGVIVAASGTAIVVALFNLILK